MSLDALPDKKYPAREVLLNDNETVIRAIVEEKWDAETNRGTPTLFQGANVSVTRIDALGLAPSISLVKATLEIPGRPDRDVAGVGKITVALLKQVGVAKQPVLKPGDPIHLLVWEDKAQAKGERPANPHHAEIVAYADSEHTKGKEKKITLGYSRMLARAVHVYAIDRSGAVIGESPPLDWTKAEEVE
ncbi:hypothetical protein [Pseudomonas syringae]|uniref:hypothetical protein n=1 Tax=Pseudomonas syringae TaxID=317 RepID=UPI000CDB5FD6|nr:hypothetical protein [Pseudomonas syringae]POR57279.1 hypothetical protein BKM23_24995 [Pseudomonas syringae pv. syringae]